MSAREVIRDHLESYAIPFYGVDSRAEATDWGPLVEVLSSTSVVGLGESAHKTREFPLLKQHIGDQLVRKSDFDVFAMEWPFPETLLLNDYVLGHTDDLTAARAAYSGYFDYWLGQEWPQVLDWLRTHNEGLANDEAVPVYGFTKTYSGAPADALLDFLDRADEECPDSIREGLEVLQNGLFDRASWSIRDDRLRAARNLLPTIRNRLTEHREDQIAATSTEDWEVARQHVRILEQACSLQAALDDPDRVHRGVRDQYMAENIDWIAEHVPADRIVVSAANSHVQAGPSEFSSLDVSLMGTYLRDRYEDDYYALAADFGYGRVRANRPASEGDGLELDEFELPPPYEMATFEDQLDSWGTFTEADLAEPQLHEILGDCDFEGAVFDFDALMTDEVLYEWLREPHLLHAVGNRHWPSAPERSISAYVLPEQFDGLLYIEEIHPMTPLGD